MNNRLTALVLTLLAFGVYSTFVVVQHGYFGFIELALAEPWGGQMFLDLVIALALFMTWMIRDARERSITAWPFVVVTLALGSIGALLYLAVREVRAPRRALAL